jgi:hypothetical protein
MNGNQQSERLGLRATARALGISHPALHKAVTSGRVDRGADGKFDVEACRAALERNTHPIKSRSARAQQQHEEIAESENVEAELESTAAEADLLAGVAGLDPDAFVPDEHSLAEATRQLEWARARREQTRAARESGVLVELAPVNAYVAGMIMRARDELSRIPTELRDVLAQERDPLKIEATLRNRIDGVLFKMSEFRRAA